MNILRNAFAVAVIAYASAGCQSTTEKRVKGQACMAAGHSMGAYAHNHKSVTMRQGEYFEGKDGTTSCCKVLADDVVRTEVCITERLGTDGRFTYDYRRDIFVPGQK